MSVIIRFQGIMAPEMILECHDWAPVGSRITCDPPPMDTDENWLLLVKSLTKFDEIARRNYWKLDSSMGNSPEFASFVFRDVNLIATQSDQFFKKFMAATSVAKRFNLLDKSDRIALFRAVLYGERASED